jgi:hypothetical protein
MSYFSWLIPRNILKKPKQPLSITYPVRTSQMGIQTAYRQILTLLHHICRDSSAAQHQELYSPQFSREIAKRSCLRTFPPFDRIDKRLRRNSPSSSSDRRGSRLRSPPGGKVVL